MFYPHYDAFNISVKEGWYRGYIAEEDFFLFLEIEDNLTESEGYELLKSIKEDVLNSQIDNLHIFDTVLTDKIKQLNLPLHASVAAGFLKENVLYFKTINKGCVYLNRGAHFALLLTGMNTASGIMHKNDFFIATSRSAASFIESKPDNYKKNLHTKEPRTVSQELLAHDDLIASDMPGALFIKVIFQDELPVSFPNNQTIPASADTLDIPEKLNSSNLSSSFLKTHSSKKTATLIVVGILVVILIWSVGLGYQRREQERRTQKIAAARTTITSRLIEAEDIAFLNAARASELIKQSQDEFTQLKSDLNNRLSDGDRKSIAEIESLIEQKEREIVKKEEKSFDEFYDLTLESKDAKGTRLFLEGDEVNILDTESETIYTLSLTKKSLRKNRNSSIKKASLSALIGDNVFFIVPAEGIYRISSDGKTSKVVDDKNLNNVADIAVYNNNIYLLDAEEGNIYKYTPTTDGYSNKITYFGSSQNMGDSDSLAIDSSVYIDLDDSVSKYSSGAADAFKTSFPDKDIDIKKVITNTALSNVYVWDKVHGKIYKLEKNGVYVSQVESKILAEGSDVVVFDDRAFVLNEEKIYTVDLL